MPAKKCIFCCSLLWSTINRIAMNRSETIRIELNRNVSFNSFVHFIYYMRFYLAKAILWLHILTPKKQAKKNKKTKRKKRKNKKRAKIDFIFISFRLQSSLWMTMFVWVCVWVYDCVFECVYACVFECVYRISFTNFGFFKYEPRYEFGHLKLRRCLGLRADGWLNERASGWEGGRVVGGRGRYIGGIDGWLPDWFVVG